MCRRSGTLSPFWLRTNKHCVAPKNLTGYTVVEKQMLLSHFDVATSCAIGYAGKPVASACGDDGKPYILSGCEWDTNPCTSPKDTLGYRVKENDLIKSKFNVEATRFGSNNQT